MWGLAVTTRSKRSIIFSRKCRMFVKSHETYWPHSNIIECLRKLELSSNCPKTRSTTMLADHSPQTAVCFRAAIRKPYVIYKLQVNQQKRNCFISLTYVAQCHPKQSHPRLSTLNRSTKIALCRFVWVSMNRIVIGSLLHRINHKTR